MLNVTLVQENLWTFCSDYNWLILSLSRSKMCNMKQLLVLTSKYHFF